MEKSGIGVILFVIVFVGAIIGGYAGGFFGTKGSSTTGAYIAPNCRYQTVTGEFIPSHETIILTYNCSYFGDNNYDPFVYGWVYTHMGRYNEMCGNVSGNTLYEYSCVGNPGYNQSMITSVGTCTLGCNNGACIKSKRVLLCGEQSSQQANVN